MKIKNLKHMPYMVPVGFTMRAERRGCIFYFPNETEWFMASLKESKLPAGSYLLVTHTSGSGIEVTYCDPNTGKIAEGVLSDHKFADAEIVSRIYPWDSHEDSFSYRSEDMFTWWLDYQAIGAKHRVGGPVRVGRLIRLAEHLESGKLGHTYFSATSISKGKRKKNGCGRCGNHAGEIPFLHPEEWEWDDMGELDFEPFLKNSNDCEESLQQWFGLDLPMLHHLFFSGWQIPGYYGGQEITKDTTADEIANLIREFVAVAMINGWNQG